MARWRWKSINAILLLLLMAGVATAEPKRVLLLHSFGSNFAPWNEFASSTRQELTRLSPDPIDLYEASLATARFEGDEEGPFVNYLRALFATRRLDLIVTVGGPAAIFIQKHRALFSAPLLLAGVEQRAVASAALTADDAVLAIQIDLPLVFENILRVLPDTTNIAIVLGNSPIERYWRGPLRLAAEPLLNRVKFEWFENLTFEQILNRAAALPPKTAIFFALQLVDAAGVTYEEAKAFRRLHSVTSAPIFSYEDTNFGRGVVGGPMIPATEAGRAAAGVALRILSGEPAGTIKTAPLGFAPPRFDWRELQRWNIREARLPPGSQIDFRSPTVWEQYRWQLASAAAIVLFQSSMIWMLLVQRRRRVVAESEARGRLLEVMHLNRTVAASAMSASFAHELHQPLGAILCNAEAAEILLARETANPNLDEIKDILSDIRRADQRACDIIGHLRGLLKKNEIELKEFDLNQVFRDAMDVLEPEAAKRGVELKLKLPRGTTSVRADNVHLLQVVLNLAINGMDAMQVSDPGKRTLTIESALRENSEVEVSVLDSGTGIPSDKFERIFDPFYTTKAHGTGIGLSIARTIVEAHGGTIWAENWLGGGAAFRFMLPLAKAD